MDTRAGQEPIGADTDTFLVHLGTSAKIDAKSIRKQASLTNWLYGVTYRLAMLVARRKVRRRETGLVEPLPLLEPDVLGKLTESHDRQLIDEELNALPAKYRQPIVLHYLSGQTQQQVAVRQAEQVEGGSRTV